MKVFVDLLFFFLSTGVLPFGVFVIGYYFLKKHAFRNTSISVMEILLVLVLSQIISMFVGIALIDLSGAHPSSAMALMLNMFFVVMAVPSIFCVLIYKLYRWLHARPRKKKISSISQTSRKNRGQLSGKVRRWTNRMRMTGFIGFIGMLVFFVQVDTLDEDEGGLAILLLVLFLMTASWAIAEIALFFKRLR